MTTSVAPPFVLGSTDVVAGRNFTHPDHIEADRAIIYLLARDLHGHLAEIGATPAPVIRHIPSEKDWHRRLVIPDPSAVSTCETLTIVGFFGRIRDTVEPEVALRIKELSDALVDRVIETPGVLSYTSHLLSDERNYANLVVLADPSVIEGIGTARPHPEAAREVSPRYYRHVRIYRGSIAGSALCDGTVTLDSVKYWDYRDDPVWHAVRMLDG